ncbi:ATPase, T2SS/T4P/T4SS family [Coxiella-like endosymbiont]
MASDIHFETFEDKLVVRFRCEDVFREILQIPRVYRYSLFHELK